MARLCSNRIASIFYGYYEMALLLFLLLLQICSQPVSCRSTVEFLPGFHGPLPVQLETGYVGVGESEEVQVFYYFIKSKNNPQEDPILLWLSEVPGFSSFTGLIYEIGSLAFIERYNESLPNLVLRPQTWTEYYLCRFAAGTGFFYAKSEAAVQQGDWNIIHHSHQFLRKRLIDHPEYLSNKVYLSGNSYSGIPIPAISLEISNGNENGIQPWINLEGYVLGSPMTSGYELNYAIPFAHGMALFSDELYESLQKNCKGEYTDLDPENLLCLRDFQSFQEGNKFLLSDYWANSDVVRQALHVRKGTVKNWTLCNGNIPFKYEIDCSFYYHVNLSTRDYRSLIYRYTRTYSNRMTFATVKGAGHTAPVFKPEECLAMLNRWISNEPL